MITMGIASLITSIFSYAFTMQYYKLYENLKILYHDYGLLGISILVLISIFICFCVYKFCESKRRIMGK